MDKKVFLLICLPPILFNLAAAAAADKSIPFGGASFEVRGSIDTIAIGKNLETIRFHESYSRNQQMANIAFELASGRESPFRNSSKPLSGSFYFNKLRGYILLVEEDSYRCLPSSLSALTSLLYSDLAPKFGPAQDDLVIGFAGLLFYLAKHRNRMQLVNEGQIIDVRNIDSIYYKLEVGETDLNEKITFYVYYTKESLALDSDSQPSRVIMRTSRARIIISFMQYQVLPNDDFVDSFAGAASDKRSMIADSPLLDRFNLAHIPGCSSALFGSSESGELQPIRGEPAENYFNQRDSLLTRFSFRADIRLPGLYSNSFVAYDGQIDSMRFDANANDEHRQMMDSSSSSSNLWRLRQQIFNIRENRMSHSIERSALPSPAEDASRSPIDRLLQLSGSNSKDENENEDENKPFKRNQCSITRISPTPTGRHDFSLGKLLVGADWLVYMGRARVRGIDALVYEAFDSDAPFWLEQPVAFKTARDVWQSRRPNGVSGNPLLLVELYSLALGHLHAIREKRSIPIHQFIWELPAVAPDGSRAGELFSLEEICSKRSSLNQFARVELLLEAAAESDEYEAKAGGFSSSLAVRQSRNSALLGALQLDLNIPATMVFDLESRLERRNSWSSVGRGNRSSSTQLIRLSFREAAHTNEIANLHYLGQASLAKLHLNPEQVATYTHSFAACLFLASHLKYNLQFGYSSRFRRCVIDPVRIQVSSEGKKFGPSKRFNMREDGEMEVYGLELSADKKSIATWLRANAPLEERYKFLGKNMRLRGMEPPNVFTIKRIHFEEQEVQVGADETLDNPEEMEVALAGRKFPGVGLLEGVSGNKHILPAALRSAHWDSRAQPRDRDQPPGSVTYDQCHASCLSNTDCQSFSFCVGANYKASCVISSASFRSPSVRRQLIGELMTAQSSKAEPNIIMTLADGQTVGLRRSPNCELYNKMFLELFERPTTISHKLTYERILPVQSRERCAELCLRLTINTLLKVRQSHEQLETDLRLASSISELSQAARKHGVGMRHLCRGFFYKQRSTLDELPESVALLPGQSDKRTVLTAIEEHILDEDRLPEGEADKLDGYCVLNARRSEAEMSSAGKLKPNSMNTYIVMDESEFRVELLYEKQFGVTLRKSSMTRDEYSALHLINRNQMNALPAGSARLLGAFVERGDNSQEHLKGVNAVQCAKRCFYQSAGIWPACRSFDLIHELDTDQFHCHLNTITLKRAVSQGRFDLIQVESGGERNSSADSVYRWHYEPQAGYVLDESIDEQSFELKQLELMQMSSADAGRYLLSTRINAFAILCLLIGALVSGTFAGVWLGLKLIGQPSNARETEGRTLIGPSVIEFSNQVNSEGEIVVA